jgi:hypothetical protein
MSLSSTRLGDDAVEDDGGGVADDAGSHLMDVSFDSRVSCNSSGLRERVVIVVRSSC